ncbi:hypothetical protein BH10PSE11_BH10PSE11_40320 [soil metagenome]
MSGGAILSIHTPPNLISPRLSEVSPTIARNALVLPAPWLPTSDTICPGSRSRLMPLMATRLPYSTWMSLT